MIYRRRKKYDTFEPIELLPALESVGNKTIREVFDDQSIKIAFIEIENNTQVYYVEIPKTLKVKPPALRKLAYDHEEVDHLVCVCVTDNCKVSGHTACTPFPKAMESPKPTSGASALMQLFHTLHSDLNDQVQLLFVMPRL